jgi:hypothetical protein
MKYNLGDFVRFVDEKLEGYVTRIFDDEMIGVTGEDDFEIPVQASKVTTVYGRETQGSGKVDTAKIPEGAFVDKGVHLAVISEQKAGSVVHFHLVNETSYQLLFAMTSERDKQFKGEYAGIVKPKSTEKIYAAKLTDLELWPKFRFDLIFFSQQNVPQVEPLLIHEKFKAKDFAGAKKNVPLLDLPGWLIRLDQPELIIDAQKLKESFFKPAEEKQPLEKPQHEIDLHIEKLRNDYQFLNSAEMLTIQLAQFSKSLDAAIVHQMPEITFIHGSGNGVLKNEIHKKLGKNNKVQTFMDARKEKFGYGATKVILK